MIDCMSFHTDILNADHSMSSIRISWRCSETIFSPLRLIGNTFYLNVKLRWLTVCHFVLISCLQTTPWAPCGYPNFILRQLSSPQLIGNTFYLIVMPRWLNVCHIILISGFQTPPSAPSEYPDVTLKPLSQLWPIGNTSHLISTCLGNHTFWFQITMSLHKPKMWVPSLTNILFCWWPHNMNTFDSLSSSPSTSSPSPSLTTPSFTTSCFNVLYTAIPSASLLESEFYLEGKAGRGKSFVASVLHARLQSENGGPIFAGTSALSVMMYQRGWTAHSAFGIPVSEICPYLLP